MPTVTGPNRFSSSSNFSQYVKLLEFIWGKKCFSKSVGYLLQLIVKGVQKATAAEIWEEEVLLFFHYWRTTENIFGLLVLGTH